MASRRPIKQYALDLITELRKDNEYISGLTMAPVDFAEVLRVSPEIVVEPHHENAEYGEDYLIFAIDPLSLSVGDLVILGRTPSNQPIILGIANDSNEDPFFNEEMQEFRNNAEYLRENTQHWKYSVTADSDLPLSDNTDGDLRFSKDTNTIWRWDGDGNVWVAASGASGNFVPTAGGNMTGDLTMDAGTHIHLVSAPTDPDHAVNKAYVDALFALCCGDSILIDTIVIDATDSTPCFVPSATNHTILVDTSLGPVTICLPASHLADKQYDVKDITGDAEVNNITVESEDGDLIDGNLTFVLNVEYQGATFVSDGTDWYII